MDALGPAAARHGAPGVLVDDHDLIVLHHVLAILVEQGVGLERRVHMVQQGQVVGGVEALAGFQQVALHQHRLDQLVAVLGELHLALLLVDVIVAFGRLAVFTLFLPLRLQLGDQGVHLLVEFRGVRRRAGDDQRRTRLIDEDRVHFVDDGVEQAALDPVFQAERHVVAQVVEAVFVVGAVGDVAGVGLAFFRLRLLGVDHAHAQAQEFVQRAHPVGVPRGQVVVDRDHVHALAGQGVQVGRQGGGQGFTLTGAHLRDAPFVQRDAAHQLDVEVAHAHHPGGRLADHRERFRQYLVKGLAVGERGLQLGGLGLQRAVIQFRHGVAMGVDPGHQTADPLELAVILGPEDFFDDGSQHETSVYSQWVGRKRAILNTIDQGDKVRRATIQGRVK